MYLQVDRSYRQCAWSGRWYECKCARSFDGLPYGASFLSSSQCYIPVFLVSSLLIEFLCWSCYKKDTVVDAGKFDGALGIISAISAMKVLKVTEKLEKLKYPVEVSDNTFHHFYSLSNCSWSDVVLVHSLYMGLNS